MTDEEALLRAIEIAGGAAQLARDLGVTKQAVHGWRRCPAARCLDVERITGVSRHDLRPDIYGTKKKRNRDLTAAA